MPMESSISCGARLLPVALTRSTLPVFAATVSVLVAGCADLVTRTDPPEPRALVVVTGTVRDASGGPLALASVNLDAEAARSWTWQSGDSGGTSSFAGNLRGEARSGEVARLGLEIGIEGSGVRRVELPDLRLGSAGRPDTVRLEIRADPPQRSPALDLPFTEVARVMSSGYEVPVRAVIRDEQALTEVWATVYSHHAPSQRPELPRIDFATHSVIVAAAGVRGAQGFAFGVEQIQGGGEVAHVTVGERIPCVTLPAMSSPVHLVSVPQWHGDATFVEVVDRRRCAQ
jgi:hypothetical protein